MNLSRSRNPELQRLSNGRHKMLNLLPLSLRELCLACCALAFCVLTNATAQDAGMVTQLQGEASYQGAEGGDARVTSFMKIRPGDQVRVPASTSLKLVYFKSATAEVWRGPATFVVGSEKSELGNGQVTVTALPQAAQVPVELARISSINRIGAVVVRGIKPPEADVKQARERYDAWRAQAPADDLLPDLYLYSVLKQYERKDEMKVLADDVLKRFPNSEEAKSLARANAGSAKK